MILAAGFGTRLRPLTESTPKPLLQVGGTPLLVWNLLMLRESGIKEVIVNLHYLGHLIQETLGDGKRWGMHVSYSCERNILGTGGALKAAESFFEGQPFLVVNGDTLIDLDIPRLVHYHHAKGGIATLVVRDDPQAQHWGPVHCDANGRVLRIIGKGKDPEEDSGEISVRMFAGVHLLHPSILGDWPTGHSFSIIDPYIQELARGSRIFGFVHAGYWSDIGTLDRYGQAQADVEAGKLILPQRKG